MSETQEQTTNEPEGEFDLVWVTDVGARPVMSVPRAVKATNKVLYEVMDVTGVTDRAKATEIADWLVNKLIRYAANYAEPVFTMEGVGPVCSYCGMIWPLCGHHHWSAIKDNES